MIAYLSGKILNKGNGFVILRVGDVGYKVYVNTAMLADFKIGHSVEIYTHQNVREDALDLFGFKNLEELELFEMLISISGIGPKTGLGVLSVGSIESIKESIAHGDSQLLTKVSGIGKKTAERVVLELKDKMGNLVGSRQATYDRSLVGDEIDALITLGYSIGEARDALRMVGDDIKDSGKRIKEALKNLSRQ